MKERSKMLVGIAALIAGAWGVSLALAEVYDSIFVNHYTAPLSYLVIGAVLINSLATCWLGMRFMREDWVSTLTARFNGVQSAFLPSGILLIATGIAATCSLFFAIYLVYLFRSVFPWNDPEDPLALYRCLDMLITSACACWLGVKLVRQRRTQLPLERAV